MESMYNPWGEVHHVMGTRPTTEDGSLHRVPGEFTSAFDWEVGTPLSELIHEGIATATRSSLDEIAPLAESVDPDAIDRLFENHVSGVEKPQAVLRFTHEECLVQIHAQGRLSIRTRRGTASSLRTRHRTSDTSPSRSTSHAKSIRRVPRYRT
jgi:hypothetical protein